MKESTWNNAVAAGIWGLISAFSLFIGALVGVSFKVSHQTNGLIMAFGAGALLFAVAIEMFAAGLKELEEGEGSASMNILVLSSVVGAIFYTMVNKCLTGGKGGGHGEQPNGEKEGYDLASTSENSQDAGGHGEAADTSVAFSIWLGILIDGVPESMLIGFMQSEGELSIAFIVAVFLANFPEAMSASAIMFRGGDSMCKIMCMWSALFLGTGAIAFLTSLIFPGHCHTEEDLEESVCEFPGFVNILASASEGLAGGSMMACISTAMLPEAFEEGGDYAGLFTLLGFLASLFVKLTLEKHEAPGAICAHQCVGFFEEHENLLIAGSEQHLPYSEPLVEETFMTQNATFY